MASTYDIVLYGPTGVTGREVARYLDQRAAALDLTWAVAGRDPDRIRDTLETVGASPDAVLTADSTDEASIVAMVDAARVVANLVGPYARYGEPVYRACARSGTHHLDLTGETDWLRQMIDAYEADAQRSGAKIVPTSGFEALPFDLGALLAATTAHERSGSPVVSVEVAVSTDSTGRPEGMSDVVSGGTFTSGVEAIRRGMDGAPDPYELDPPGAATGGRYDLRPHKHPATGDWLGPMFPSPYLNPPIAHRSAALLRAAGDKTFSPAYRYREGTVTASMGPARLAPVSAAALSLLSAGFGLIGRAPDRIRHRLADAAAARGPQPGEGPRPESLDDWSYRLDVRATCENGTSADVVVEANGHPGYKSTATMIGEAACLLADRSAAVPERNGFLTPATALGLAELDRFRHAGVAFRPV